MWPSVSSHRLLTPPKRFPNPSLPYLDASQGLQDWPNAPSLIFHGEKIFLAPGSPPVGVSKPWEAWQHLCIPFLGAAPGLSREMRMTSSAFLLQKAFPWSGCYPAKKTWHPQAPPVVDGSHALRGLHPFPEGWSKICIHPMDFEYDPKWELFLQQRTSSSLIHAQILLPQSTDSLGTSSQMSLRCLQAALRPDLSVGHMGKISFYLALGLCDCCIVGWWWCAMGVMRALSATLPTTAPRASPEPL